MNLALRFALEVAALVAVARGAAALSDGALAWVLATSAVLAFMGLWATFAVPGDPSRGGEPVVVVPGLARLVLELALFAGASVAWASVDGWAWGGAFAAVTAAHYAVSWDRIGWLMAR